jgi:hypothetical protein
VSPCTDDNCGTLLAISYCRDIQRKEMRMKPNQTVAALVAGTALLWGSAHAAPEAAEAAEVPEVIILELQPNVPGVAPGSEQEQALVTMMLLQLLGAVQAEGGNVEMQFVAPEPGQRI